MDNILNFTKEGTGKPVVFIHGFCESSEIWPPFIGHFTATYQVICIDLPGHGKSPGTGPSTSVDGMAEQVFQTLSTLLSEKPVLIGHSLGGYVTLAYAEKYPDSLAGFCLFHSSAFEDSPEKKENRNKTAGYVKQHGVDAFCNPFVPGLFFQKRREELRESIVFATSIARKMTVDNIINTVYAMRDRRERLEVLSQARIPVAFIIGKGDTAVPFEKSLEQCHLPAVSSVLFLSETGHMGMFEREKESASFLRGFLLQVFGFVKETGL